MMAVAILAAVSSTITVQPLVSEEVLEPSVFNEVEHALDRAEQVSPTNLPPFEVSSNLVAKMIANKDATARAIALVSMQRSDGRWMIGTNNVTQAAVEELRRLSGIVGSEPEIERESKK